MFKRLIPISGLFLIVLMVFVACGQPVPTAAPATQAPPPTVTAVPTTAATRRPPPQLRQRLRPLRQPQQRLRPPPQLRQRPPAATTAASGT